MFRQIFSTTVNWLSAGSEFGNYYKVVQKGNCGDGPNCQGGTGPSIDEARRDFRAMHKIGVFV